MEVEDSERHFCHLVTFWFSTFTMYLHAPRSLVGHATLKDEWYIVIKGSTFLKF